MYWANRLATILAYLAAGLAVTMFAFVTLSSLMRYIIGSPFSFTEELVGLLFTAMIFAGIPVITLRQKHICVTIVPDLLSSRGKDFMLRVSHLLILVFCVWFGKLTWDYLQITVSLDARSAGSRLVLWPWTAVLPLSCALSGLAALFRVIGPASAFEAFRTEYRGD